MKLGRVLRRSALVLIIAGAVYLYYPPFRYFVLFAAGRSPQCSLRQALESADALKQQVEDKDQILNASKLVDHDLGFEQWETPRGRYWIPVGSRYRLPFDLAAEQRGIYGSGQYGPRKGDIVLDCGAGVGVAVHDELAAGAQTVVAIEPAPENLECLRRNYRAEIAAGRVIVVPKGVWDKDDFLTLRVDPSNSGADSFVLRNARAVEIDRVPLVTIDELVAELKLPRVDYIKLDVSGAEAKVLEGAKQTLAKFKPRLSVATYSQPEQPAAVPALVRAARADYQMDCGPCSEAGHALHPDILYFK